MTTSSRTTLPLDVLLVLALGMGYLWFNPVSNTLAITLVAIYVLLGWWFPELPDEQAVPTVRARRAFLARVTILLFLVMLTNVLPTAWNMMQRHAGSMGMHTHDGVFQTEAAIEFILQGKNPYVETYWQTPMANWQRGEPPWTTAPLYHNAYQPFLFLLSIPFYVLIQATLGWYDQRFVYLIFFLALILLLPRLASKQRDQLSLLAAFGLNLLWGFFLSDGRNDVVILFGLVVTTILLARQHITASAVVLGLTLAVKQPAAFFVPFYLAYLVPEKITAASLRHLAWQVGPMLVVPALIVAPFFFWDPRAFLDDTIFYLMGATEYSFPIKGWGASTLLLAFGVIPSPESNFPFSILEALFGIPALVLLLRWQRRANTLRQIWIGFAAWSFVIEYFSRFFNDSYVVFIAQAIVIAAFIAPTQTDVSP